MTASHGTIDIVRSAFRSVVSTKRLAYLSAPITSGKRAMAALDAGISKREVVRENIAIGNDLARKIASSHNETIIAPTIFDGTPQDWSQSDYMAMWLGMIEENIGDIYMSPDWAYSNGCAEEYLKAINMAYGFGARSSITPRTPTGEILPLHEGLAALSESLHVLQERGKRAETLASVFLGLYAAHIAWTTPDLMHDLPSTYNREVVGSENNGRVTSTVREVTPLLARWYNWKGDVQLCLTDGAIRTISAWPEGVVLDTFETE